MFARISFDEKQRVSSSELEGLKMFLSDEIDNIQLYVKVANGEYDDKPFEFYSWNHTLDPLDLEKEDNKKELVRAIDKFELKTNKEYLTNLDSFLSKYPSLKIRVRGIPHGLSEVNMFSNIINQMTEIENKLENALKSFDKTVEFNQKCDVHISNLGLLHINQIGYAVDKCTEELQTILKDGWRIIACCVQPDQRRPDYVLGRYNPEENNVECVKF